MNETLEAEVGGELYKSHVVIVDPPRGVSSQPVNDDDPTLATPDDALEPPESLERIARQSHFGNRGPCIEAIVTNTVGLGYSLAVADARETDESDARERIAECRARLEAASRRDVRAGKPSFVDQLKAAKHDEETCGNGGLEISRNKIDGKIDGIFRVPGQRVRRLKSRQGYMLLPPDGDSTNATRFTEYGSKVEYDEQGQPTSRLTEDHRGGWSRNEYLPFRLFSNESRDYGLPRDMHLTLEYLGDKLASEANATFFANGGALPTVLFIQGDEERDGGTVNVRVPAETTQRIYDTLRAEGSGPGGGGRVAIVPLPAGVKAQKEVLGSMSDRDLGHVVFREDVRQRTLSAFRLMPIFIGLTEDSQYGAEVERAITKEQVFDPEQTRYEERLGETIIRDLGFPELALTLNDLAVENDQTKRDSAEKTADRGVITRRAYLKAHGMPAQPEAAKADAEIEWRDGTYKSVEPEPGQVPFGWNDELLPVVTASGGTPELVEGEGQQGLRPGVGSRGSRDKGQAQSAAEGRTEGQVRRLAGRNGTAGRAGAKRALERARALPTED